MSVLRSPLTRSVTTVLRIYRLHGACVSKEKDDMGLHKVGPTFQQLPVNTYSKLLWLEQQILVCF
jgi:hypothetical protein